MSHERLLRIYILGCLKLLRLGSINCDQIHWLVFNPAFQREVEAIGFVDLANIISEGLFIEDVLSLCGELEYEKLLSRIEFMTLNGLAKSYCQIWCSETLSGALVDLDSIFKLDACDDFIQIIKAA